MYPSHGTRFVGVPSRLLSSLRSQATSTYDVYFMDKLSTFFVALRFLFTEARRLLLEFPR